MEVFCGIDWAEDHHDIALVDREGRLLARQRIGDDAAGLAELLALLADHGDEAEDPIPVAIETPRGLLTACLRATGRRVYPINPMAVARYRDRHSIAGRKSDHGDAVVLANILRTDAHAHRPLPADSELAQAIAVLARAQQDAVWARTTAHNKLRSQLREYYPGFLAAFAEARGGITRPEARAILAAAPDPAAAAKLTKAQLQALLKRAGRTRGIAVEAARLREALRQPQMRQLPLVEQAMVARRSPCSVNSMPHASAPTTSNKPPSKRSTSTLTLRSSPASQGSAHSAAPEYSPRSATTDPASVIAKASRPTRAPRRSPARAARPPPWPTAGSRTTGSARLDTPGPSPRSPPHPAPEPTTTAADKPKTGTPPRSGTSSHAYSAACTTASPPASTTTSRPPSPPRRETRRSLLDNQTASDVFIASERHFADERKNMSRGALDQGVAGSNSVSPTKKPALTCGNASQSRFSL